MKNYTREDTARSILEQPEMKRYLSIFVDASLTNPITEEYLDKTLNELEQILSMPWGGPFIPEILLDGTKRVKELLEDRFAFIPLWQEAEEDFMPETKENNKENVCLMRLRDTYGDDAMANGEVNRREDIDPDIKSTSASEGTGPRPAAILCPGGGYELLSVQNEGIDMAERLDQEGYVSFVLFYRVSPNRYPEPQKDLALAIKYLRANAEKFGIDPQRILIAGASAAGHLCASESAYHEEIDAFLMEDLRERTPALAKKLEGISAKADNVCLTYPVIDFSQYAHEPSFQAVSGGDEKLRDKLSIQKHVPADFPKTFVWANRDDALVPYENSELIANALKEKGIKCELHIYPQGGHGCGLAKGTSAEGWMDAMLRFLS